MSAISSPPITRQPSVAPLVNNLGSTELDGTLETVPGLDAMTQGAISRNFSELNAKINRLRMALEKAQVLR